MSEIKLLVDLAPLDFCRSKRSILRGAPIDKEALMCIPAARSAAMTLLALLLLSWSTAMAAESRRAIILVDLRPDEAAKTGNRVFVISLNEKPTELTQICQKLSVSSDCGKTLRELKNVDDQCNKSELVLSLTSLFDKEETAKKLRACTTDRILSGAGDALDAFVLYVSPTPSTMARLRLGLNPLVLAFFSTPSALLRDGVDFEWEEVARKSRLAEDTSTLLDTLRKSLFSRMQLAEVLKGEDLQVAYQRYYLEKRRGTLRLIATKGEKQTATIKTGPPEHWYLSADVPVNTVRELKFNESSMMLEPKKSPNEVLLGMNYMFGDLLSDHEPWGNRFSVKFLIEFSDEPLETVGIAIGYRLQPKSKILGMDLELVSPFAGYVWTKEDEMTAGGSVERNASYTGEFRVGLSFNLDKAASWFRSD